MPWLDGRQFRRLAVDLRLPNSGSLGPHAGAALGGGANLFQASPLLLALRVERLEPVA